MEGNFEVARSLGSYCSSFQLQLEFIRVAYWVTYLFQNRFGVRYQEGKCCVVET